MWRYLCGFSTRGVTIDSEYYCRVLRDVHTLLRKKRLGLIIKGVLFHQDKARAHTAHRTTYTLQQFGWEVLPHPIYSPDLALSDFHA